MKHLLLAAALAAPALAHAQKPTAAQPENLVQYAHPMVGTQKMGHTYPGATVPFGMVQLSPDTDTISYEQNGKYNPNIYRYCAGYNYDDRTIVGFSHTHFSGTGHSDLGDFLLMPTSGPLQLNPGTADRPASGYRSAFSHQNEVAEPAYYKVKLDDHNITAELPGWNFDQTRRASQQLWQQELARITIQTPNRADKENFYTALYHASLSPTIYQDVDGQYRGLDQQTHRAEGFVNYTTFSLWDTFRALHPLFNLIQPTRNADMVQSMLAHYDQSAEHMLPVWSHHANENWCMSGYHSTSVVADAVLNGTVPPAQAERALAACVATAHHRWYDGLDSYIDRGYVPSERSGTSVSTTLEFAYDDWCIAQLAQKLGHPDLYQEFSQRATNWQNVFDPRANAMRPRLADGSFRPKFDVLSTNGQGFIEGNAWNYTLAVPHDPAGLIAKMGGNARFVPHLDSLFTMSLPDSFFAETEDITREGIIGGYVHGNEPAHHAAYLYNYTDQPWRTQVQVRTILARQYHPTPDGLGGNDDCGQMSAWYLFSALGFYPVAPASGQYALGSPLVHGAILHLENGREFTIQVKNQSPKNVYVQSATLNGQRLVQPFLAQADVVKGGRLVFVMQARPARK